MSLSLRTSDNSTSQWIKPLQTNHTPDQLFANRALPGTSAQSDQQITKTVSAPMEDSVLKLADDDPICTPMEDSILKLADDDPTYTPMEDSVLKLADDDPICTPMEDSVLKTEDDDPIFKQPEILRQHTCRRHPPPPPFQKIMTMDTIRNQEKQYSELVRYP